MVPNGYWNSGVKFDALKASLKKQDLKLTIYIGYIMLQLLLILCTYTHNCSLQSFSYDHELTSHTTLCFIHKSQYLQFKTYSERQIFLSKHSCKFYLFFFTLRGFCKNLLKTNSRFHICFCSWCLKPHGFILGFMSNKPKHTTYW